MTRAELIEQYFLDPTANPGHLPSKIRFAAVFADLSSDDQNTALNAWVASRKAELDANVAEIRTKADEIEALAADIEASKP